MSLRFHVKLSTDDYGTNTYRNCNDDVCVTLQHLDDFSGLQVPQIHFIIFTTGDDPLSTSYAETCNNAVVLIDVACVCFQATGCLVIPQTDGTVMCRREDVLRVRRELHMLTGGV